MALCITNPLLGPKSFQTRPPYPPLISLPTITTTTTIRAELNYSHPTGKSSSSSQLPSPATPATPKLTTKANPERPKDRENSKMDQNSSWHKLKKYLKRKFSKEKNLLQENHFDIDWVLLQSVVQRLTVSPPIVFAGEAHKLQERLGEAAMGNAFLLQAGDGSFEEINADTLRVILQMNSVLMFGGQMPVIKVGNQVARLASDLKLSTSHPDQSLMKAYQLQTGGYAAIQRVPQWDLDFMENSEHGDRYRELASQVDEALGFMLAAGHTVDHPTDFWTSHECLPYDGSLITCKYSTSSLSYDCSSHFLWVSERTCQLDGAHVKFLRGIGNPLGIKVSHKMDPKKLVKLIGILNPEKKPGRITIITRMGAENLKLKLPNIVREIKRVGQIVTWVTDPDPMPRNIIKASRSLKPHPFDAIRAEVRAFFDVHEQEGSHPGGVHLEMAGQNKTEVNSGSRTTTFGNTHCDPRLNAPQLLELAFIIAERLQKLHPTD